MGSPAPSSTARAQPPAGGRAQTCSPPPAPSKKSPGKSPSLCSNQLGQALQSAFPTNQQRLESFLAVSEEDAGAQLHDGRKQVGNVCFWCVTCTKSWLCNRLQCGELLALQLEVNRDEIPVQPAQRAKLSLSVLPPSTAEIQ